MRKNRRFVTAGDLKSVIYSFLIGLILCTPLCGTEGMANDNIAVASVVTEETITVVEEVKVEEPVVTVPVVQEIRELKLSARSSTQDIIRREIVIESGDQSTVSSTPIVTNEIIVDPEPVQPEVIEISEPVLPVNTKNIAKPSNLTAEEFDILITNTLSKYKKHNSKLYGLGDALYEIEQTYGINGLFVLSIASNESGWGTRLANTNNIGGITKKGGGFRAFESPDECIKYMGKLLANSYIGQGRTTVQAVGNKYCPSTASKPDQNIHWANTVSDIMNRYEQVAKSIDLI